MESLIQEALYGVSVMEMRDLLEERMNLVYEALRSRPDDGIRDKYRELAQLCAVKRSYEVPPEYSGILNVEQRRRWSPTDIEIARVLVAVTKIAPGTLLLYSDLVARIGATVTMARPHIYRSLKVILRSPPDRSGGVVVGVQLLA